MSNLQLKSQSYNHTHVNRSQPKRALVLGCGAVAGAAWMIPALAQVRKQLNWNPEEADVFVGTSVGAVLVSLMAGGVSLDDLIASQEEKPSEKKYKKIWSHDKDSGSWYPPLPVFKFTAENLYKKMRRGELNSFQKDKNLIINEFEEITLRLTKLNENKIALRKEFINSTGAKEQLMLDWYVNQANLGERNDYLERLEAYLFLALDYKSINKNRILNNMDEIKEIRIDYVNILNEIRMNFIKYESLIDKYSDSDKINMSGLDVKYDKFMKLFDQKYNIPQIHKNTKNLYLRN